MSAQNSITINPEILQWALDIEGCDPKELADELNISLHEVNDLLSERHPIQLTQLKTMAHYLKLPLTTFLLSKPPYESKLSFNKIPGTTTVRPSKKMLQAIREAYYLQSVSRNLLKENGYDNPEPTIERYTLRDNPEKIARIQRERLGFESIPDSRPHGTNKHVHMYSELAKRIEGLDIFVHQLRMPVEEARGFALIDDLPRAIVLNVSDHPRLRIFTLLHEYAHLLLGATDNVCSPNCDLETPGSPIETWCNDFAGSFLMPEEELGAKVKEFVERFDRDRALINLGSHFYSSKHAVLARMNRLRLETKHSQFYKKNFEEIRNKELSRSVYRRRSNQIKKEGRMTERDKKISACLDRVGARLIRLVLESDKKGLVTSSDIIDYLDLHPRYLNDLEGAYSK